MPNAWSGPEPQVLLDGLGMGESPRWHDGRLWISLSNRRVWAGVTGDTAFCLRVRESGEVLDRIELDRPCYACMLGGEDGRTLFMVVARWFGPDRIDELVQAKAGQVLTARAAVSHAGWP